MAEAMHRVTLLSTSNLWTVATYQLMSTSRFCSSHSAPGIDCLQLHKDVSETEELHCNSLLAKELHYSSLLAYTSYLNKGGGGGEGIVKMMWVSLLGRGASGSGSFETLAEMLYGVPDSEEGSNLAVATTPVSVKLVCESNSP
ncbi:hypothetical protein Ancab_039433 [Ancistrocladus abbreviatus]